MFKFLNWFKGANTLVADRGSVYCPVRKLDLEVDNCFGCERLIEAKEVGGTLEVRCESPTPPARLAPY